MSENDTKRSVYGILEFLQEEFSKSSTSVDSKESIEVAMQCLETAFGVNLKDVQYKPKVSLRNALNGNAGSSSSSQTQAQAPRNEGIVDTGEAYSLPEEANAVQQQQADGLKNMGNEKMKEGQYEAAKQCYDRAIELDGRNAVYFCNRAAAFLKLDNVEQALRDCQIAIQLQPNYARAYGRMGVIYSTVNKHVEAANCYRKACQLDPVNESYQNNLKLAEDYEALASRMATGADNGAGPQVPNFQAMFSDPNLINMASQMLQNPMMMNMLRTFMSSFRGGQGPEGAPAGGNNMEGILQMGQAIAQQLRAANPNLADQLGSLGNQAPRSSPHGDSYDL